MTRTSQTFGVGATFVTSAKVPDEVVYVVVKAVFDNFDTFKKLHPAFANLKEEEMIADSLSAPHPSRCTKILQGTGLGLYRAIPACVDPKTSSNFQSQGRLRPPRFLCKKDLAAY